MNKCKLLIANDNVNTFEKNILLYLTFSNANEVEYIYNVIINKEPFFFQMRDFFKQFIFTIYL